jgi:death-on-curing protein
VIRFVPLSAVLTIHAELLREFGGKSGMRDRGLLESALARPKHLHLYEKADLFRLAAAYAFGVIKNHPFIDGNKRTGLVVAYAFLNINKVEMTATEEEATIVMLGVADSSVDEKTLAAWFQANSKPVRHTSK